ncbi:MAG: YHYH protein, partial [Candidatus Poribacteria bacterium]|nr:YHYH protein [Candidatus Poribacteria bacterium]
MRSMQGVSWLILLLLNMQWAIGQKQEPQQLKWFATEINVDHENINYPKPELSVSFDDIHIIIESNGIPNFEFVETTPNGLGVQNHRWQIPRIPVPSTAHTQIPLLGAVAFTTTGLPIYGPNEAGHPHPYGDPYVNQILDYCHGHTGGQADYHFHAAPECLIQHSDGTEEHYNIVGFALDGYPLIAHYKSVLDSAGNPILDADDQTQFVWLETSGYQASAEYQKSVLDDGEKSTYVWDHYTYQETRLNRTLDECNGRPLTDQIVRDSQSEKDFFNFDYGYFLTGEFPYFIAKYRGKVSQENLGRGERPDSGHRADLGNRPVGDGPEGKRPALDHRPIPGNWSMIYLKPLYRRSIYGDSTRPYPKEEWGEERPHMDMGWEELDGKSKGDRPLDRDPTSPHPKEAWGEERPHMDIGWEELDGKGKGDRPLDRDPTRSQPNAIDVRGKRQPVVEAPPVGENLPIGIFLRTTERVQDVFCELTYDPTTLRWQKIEPESYSVDGDTGSSIEIKQVNPGLVIFQIHHPKLQHSGPLAVAIFSVIQAKDSALGFVGTKLVASNGKSLKMVTQGITLLKGKQSPDRPDDLDQPDNHPTQEIIGEMTGQFLASEDGSNAFELLAPVSAQTAMPIRFAEVSFVVELTIDGMDIQERVKADRSIIKSKPIQVNLKPGEYTLRERYEGKIVAEKTVIGPLSLPFDEMVIERSLMVEKPATYQIQLNTHLSQGGWIGFFGDLKGKTKLPSQLSEGIMINVRSDQDLAAGDQIEVEAEMGVVVASHTRIQPQKSGEINPPSSTKSLVFLTPPRASLPATGDRLKFDVMVEKAQRVSKFVFKLAFDPDVLAVDTVKLGDFLAQGAEELVFPAVFEAGTLSFGAESSDQTTKQTNGRLATVTFKAVGQRESKIGFSLLELHSVDGEKLDVAGRGA